MISHMHDVPYKHLSLRNSLRLVTISACLFLLYLPVTSSPIFTAFLYDMGAREFHFGLLVGIPMIMFALQFAAALMNNRIRYRKPPFMVLIIASRLIYIAIAFSPYFFPSMSGDARMLTVMLLVGLSAALSNLATPLWFAWMADLIPGRILGRYWGNKQRWMFITWVLGYLAMAVYTYAVKIPIRTSYPMLALVCVTLGITDILLFIKVPEPENSKVENVSPLQILLEPFKHREYRTFVIWTIMKSFALMTGATFMQIYALDVLKLPVWQATVTWCILGLGTAFSSRAWGRIADKHGQRPVLIITMCGKPVVALVFMLVTPATAFIVLSIWLAVDGILNAGMLVASDGYMLKIAPQRNRSMFVATIVGLSGIFGGMGAILGGRVLQMFSESRWLLLGREWNHYQLIFGFSFIIRLICIPLSFAIREARSSNALLVLQEIRDMSPSRFLGFPVGLYRKIKDSQEQR